MHKHAHYKQHVLLIGKTISNTCTFTNAVVKKPSYPACLIAHHPPPCHTYPCRPLLSPARTLPSLSGATSPMRLPDLLASLWPLTRHRIAPVQILLTALFSRLCILFQSPSNVGHPLHYTQLLADFQAGHGAKVVLHRGAVAEWWAARGEGGVKLTWMLRLCLVVDAVRMLVLRDFGG